MLGKSIQCMPRTILVSDRGNPTEEDEKRRNAQRHAQLAWFAKEDECTPHSSYHLEIHFVGGTV